MTSYGYMYIDIMSSIWEPDFQGSLALLAEFGLPDLFDLSDSVDATAGIKNQINRYKFNYRY